MWRSYGVIIIEIPFTREEIEVDQLISLKIGARIENILGAVKTSVHEHIPNAKVTTGQTMKIPGSRPWSLLTIVKQALKL